MANMALKAAASEGQPYAHFERQVADRHAVWGDEPAAHETRGTLPGPVGEAVLGQNAHDLIHAFDIACDVWNHPAVYTINGCFSPGVWAARAAMSFQTEPSITTALL